ncbi:MAG TPA: integrin alpha, partial [Actinoplanes sp.]|nr:integrin alpha [Actinoplanes sp.]
FGSQLWTQNSPGTDDPDACCDGFGTSLAAGNLGRSAHDDLAIGAPYENNLEEIQDGVGAVTVVYGSPNGLTDDGRQLLGQGLDGISGAGEYGDWFGYALAIGDFGKSGHEDLAVGVPSEGSPSSDDGSVNVIYGSATGLTAAGNRTWGQDSKGILGEAEESDMFGRSLTAANFGRSRHADLVVGVPAEDELLTDDGMLNVIYGSKDGLTAKGNQYWGTDSPGILGAGEPGDQFGGVLAAVRN